MKLTPEHRAIADTVAKFVAKEINPFVAEWEAAEIYPAHEVMKKLGNLGLLPNTALRVLGMKPGDQVRADFSPNRIDICPEPPVMAQGVIESGVLVMARQGIRMDAAAAVRADRDSQAERALPR